MAVNLDFATAFSVDMICFYRKKEGKYLGLIWLIDFNGMTTHPGLFYV